MPKKKNEKSNDCACIHSCKDCKRVKWTRVFALTLIIIGGWYLLKGLGFIIWKLSIWPLLLIVLGAYTLAHIEKS